MSAKLVLTSAALALLCGSAADAAPLYWDTNGDGVDATYGGDGTWDGSNNFWNTSATIGSGSLQAWTGGSADDASFLRGTSGNVTISGTQTAKSISFGSSVGSFTTGTAAYALAGGTIDLRQASFSVAINNNNGVNSVGGSISLFGGIAAGNNRQRVNLNVGSLTLGGVADISGVSGVHSLSLEAYSGASLSINGAITKSAGSSGVTLLAGGAGTANNVFYALGGNNTGLVATGNTFSRGTLTLNNSSALAGASSLTVDNANTTVALADTANLLIGTDAVTINKPITFTALTATDTSDIRVIGGSNATGTSTFSNTITLNAFAPSGAGSSLRVTAADGGTTVFSGNITDGSNTVPVTKLGLGTVSFTRAAGNSYDGGTTVSAGTLLVGNTSGSGVGTGNVSIAGGTLGGTGIVGSGGDASNVSFTSAGGKVAPGASPGILTVNGGIDFTSSGTATFEVELNSNVVGTGYDQLVVNSATGSTGVIDLDNATLSVVLGFTPAPTDVFTIIDNNTGSDVTGIFSGKADNSTFVVGATTFRIDYDGGVLGNGQDVVLTVVPEPVSLAGVGLAGWLLSRRRRAVA